MKDLTVTAPPHAISRLSVRHIMLCVLLALLPAAANGVFLFGMDALFLLLACVGSAMLADLLIRLILRRSMAVFDFSSAVTGLLLGLTLPEKFPFWQGAIASAAAVIVIRECFGGLGRNLLNPANAARTALMLIFPAAMQHGAASGQSWLHLLLSDSAGFIGETSAAGILLGGAFLVICGIITPLTPLAAAGFLAFFTWQTGGDPLSAVLSGQFLLTAVFMASDPTTTPLTKPGKLLFGAGFGGITFAVQYFLQWEGAAAYALLIMNLLTPLLDLLTRTRPFGAVKPQKPKKADKPAKSEKPES